MKNELRRCHVVYPGFLPKTIIEGIKPTEAELKLLKTEETSGEDLEAVWSAIPAGDSVVVRLQGSSDGVTPFKTVASSFRAVMGRYDNIYSPSQQKVVSIPKAPPFIITIYKGELKEKDFVLSNMVKEMLELKPPENGVYDKDVYCEFSQWIPDAVERAYICGCVSTAGTHGCPRCEVHGSKELDPDQAKAFELIQTRHRMRKTDSEGILSDDYQPKKRPFNGMYFYVPNASSEVLRTEEKWKSYLAKIPPEVSKT
jgi:hypothetical protein